MKWKSGLVHCARKPEWQSVGEACDRNRPHSKCMGKANGAGISADPTLTDAWSSVLAEPSRKRLAPGVSATVRRTGRTASVTGARTGIRFRPAARWIRRSAAATRRFRDRSNLDGRRSRTVPRRLALLRFLDLRPDRPASRRRCFRVLLKRSTCIRPKPSAGVPRRPRGQFPSRRNGLESFSVFRSLDRQPRSFPRPFDSPKLRRENESRKIASPRLSTFRGIRCGHEWISQPLVSNVLK